MASTRPTKQQLDELDVLRDAEWHAVREAALKSTFIMATIVLWPDMAARHYWEPAHRPLCDWIDGTPTGGKRAAIFHRQARKTMLLTIARCVRLICAHPNIRIMLISALQRTAIDMCGLIKRQFQSNQSLRHYFPEFAIDDVKFGKIDEFTVPWRGVTSYLDPTLFATYMGSPMISRRCDVLIFDDPVDDDDVNNPDMARATMRNFIKCIPLVDDTSDFRQTTFIGTFKSYNDPASAICGHLSDTEVSKDKDEQEKVTGWEVVFRPIAFVPNGDFYNPGEFAFPDENPESKPHLPNVHTPESIREIYNSCLKDPQQGESYFWREYCCLVQAPKDQKFQAEWLNTWIEPGQVPPNTILSAIAVDSALKDEQILFRGDRTVILIGHYDREGRLYLTDGAMSKGWRTDDLRRNMLAMVANPKNRSPENLIREKTGEGTLFPVIQGWFNEARRPLVMRPLKLIGHGKKYLRITEALQYPFMGRRVFFVKGQFPEHIHQVLVDELVHLGQWGHDDVADCLSLFFHPDIKPVPPNEANGRKWVTPVTRPMQQSLEQTNPGAIAAIRTWGAFGVAAPAGPQGTLREG
jgi:hypothetical protein